MSRRGSLAEQLAAFTNAPPKAANDNKPREPHYRGTLPALRWLWDNRPDLAPAFADALPKKPDNWFVDVEPTRQEIRPTIGELIKACHDEDGNALPQAIGKGGVVTIGKLRFRDGVLTQWGETKKGKKLKPTDRARPTGEKTSGARNPASYLALKGATASPMAARHYHRPMSDEPAIASMYDPLPGVEAARETLRRHGVDGSVALNLVRLPTVVADGAGFLGGVSNPSGNSSSGAVMWEAPEDVKTSATDVIEEVAARGTLKSIGLRLGYSEAHAIQAGKDALVNLADTLTMVKNRRKAKKT